MSVKLCECGCEQPAPIAKQTRSILGHIKGQPIRFINGHNSHFRKGKNNPMWNGGTTKDGKEGRLYIHTPSHPKKNCYGYVFEHILIAEKALGKYLPEDAEIHHLNRNPTDNRQKNLVICENRKYHHLLHQRQRAYDACGNARWRKCWICKDYDDPQTMYIYGKKSVHKKCWNQYQNTRYRKLNPLILRKRSIKLSV